jgi:hypothetical protein
MVSPIVSCPSLHQGVGSNLTSCITFFNILPPRVNGLELRPAGVEPSGPVLSRCLAIYMRRCGWDVKLDCTEGTDMQRANLK